MTTHKLVSSIIAESGISFGTSGARGLIEQFSDEVCAAFTIAFISTMQSTFTFDRIAIGIDRRPSSPKMAAACANAASATGLKIDYYGVLPTPALALQAMANHVPAIMITGSHIPFDRNGIKFYRPDGEITKANEHDILNAETPLPSITDNVLPPASDAANQRYLERFTCWFSGSPLAGWKVGLYQHSAAGRDLNVQILSALGAEVVTLGRSESFVPVDTEAVSEEDQVLGQSWAREHCLNTLLSTDGDGDRPLLADESGTWQRGDILGLLCAQTLGIEALAVPISCNTAIELCQAFTHVERTRIGSPFVLSGMAKLAEQYSRVAGFEANGGFLLESELHSDNRHLSALPTRDALLPALSVMVAAARQGVAISTLIAGLPRRYTESDRVQNFPIERSKALIANWQCTPLMMEEALSLPASILEIDTTDGLRAILQNGDIVHVRPSGNAPEFRCYCESSSQEAASSLRKHCLDQLIKLNHSDFE
ncbi:phosphomannomutase [Halomonas sp. NPDC076908]|uniref:phosphomannomutase n=1 Tax=Halomonas sp. NPDC076908 TaxID=3390567 RepID=UPI003D04F2CE